MDPNQTPPVSSPATPTQPPLTPPSAKNRKPIVLAIAISLVLLFLIGVVAALTRHKSNSPSSPTTAASSQYADVSHLDINHLPDGKTTFFQMMKHANLQQLIAVTHSAGFVDKNGKRVMRDLYFTQAAYTYKDGKVADFSYQDLPVEPDVRLSRCIHGKAEAKDAILVQGIGNTEWHPDSAVSGLGDACTNPLSVDIDGVFLVGGLTSQQVDSWIKAIQAIKDTEGNTPKLVFETPSVIDYNGKKVVQVVVTVNSIHDGYCADGGASKPDYCGPGSIGAAFDESTHIDSEKAGYIPLTTGHDASATFKARYYIDPATNLPIYVRDQDITNTKATYKDPDVAELGPLLEASEIQYSEPDWASISKDTLSPSAQQLKDLYDSNTIQ